MIQEQILHFPNLKTVLMVEKVLEKAEKPLSKNEVKRRLSTKIMHQTLNVVLEYLEDSNKIMIGSKGILWIFNPSPKLEKAIKGGIEV